MFAILAKYLQNAFVANVNAPLEKDCRSLQDSLIRKVCTAPPITPRAALGSRIAPELLKLRKLKF